MKLLRMTLASVALAGGAVLLGAAPASATDTLIKGSLTYSECQQARRAYEAVFPMYDYYCAKALGNDGYWNLYRDS